MNYFNENYVGRTEKWALCYRNFPHANTDTNMFVESFHNKLKTFYMDRRPNKRVDDLLNLLLVIEEDDYWRHKRDTFYNNPETKVGLNKTNKKSRHFKGVNIPDSHVLIKENGVFTVKSQSSDVHYQTKQAESASNRVDCSNHCISCLGLCEHLYICDCDDVAGICKHAHKLHSMLFRENNLRFGQGNKENEQNEISYVFQMPICNKTIDLAPSTRIVSEEEKFDENIQKSKELIKDENVQRLYLPSINRQVNDIIKQAEALVELNEGNSNLTSLSSSMTMESEFKPNEKLDHQWQPKKFCRTEKEFHPTKNFTYPSQETKQNIYNKLDLNNKSAKDETSTSTETTVATFTEASVVEKTRSKHFDKILLR